MEQLQAPRGAHLGREPATGGFVAGGRARSDGGDGVGGMGSMEEHEMSDATAVTAEPEPEDLEPGSTQANAHALGDITGQKVPGSRSVQRLTQTVGTDGDDVDYCRFELTESREARLG